jgi:hypothetical protein
MNQANDVIPRGGALPDAQPPGERAARAAAEQAPLGSQPSYDDLLDTAIDYTFPCSDPIAAGACSGKLDKRRS